MSDDLNWSFAPSCGAWLRGIALPIIAVLAIASSAAADTWDNSLGDGNWSTASDWADNTEPTDADPVIFPSPTPGGEIIYLSADEHAKSLTFNAVSQILYGPYLGTTLNIASGAVNVASGAVAEIDGIITGF